MYNVGYKYGLHYFSQDQKPPILYFGKYGLEGGGNAVACCSNQKVKPVTFEDFKAIHSNSLMKIVTPKRLVCKTTKGNSKLASQMINKH